ncbi:fungal-specific transcription factor domain-containing protein [Geopyxis carbonaria]|nr:fungal-specific transcription factor domain-containing protein [Geopyxis carbonaria]
MSCLLLSTRVSDLFLPAFYPACSSINASSVVCSYEKPYLRGTLPAVPPARSPSLICSASPPHSPTTHRIAPPSATATTAPPLVSGPPTTVSPSHSREPSPSSGAAQHESFLGSSSNLVFSHAAQHQLTQPERPKILSRSGAGAGAGVGAYYGDENGEAAGDRHFWFAEPPFPDLNVAAFSLPSKPKALEFVAWYFENASPTYRILHRPTIEAAIHDGFHGCDDEWWGPAAMGARSKVFEDKSVCAVVFMVWAIGCQFPKDINTKERIRALRQRSVQFYQCAKMQLDKERSQIDRLATLQAKLLMTIYLLTTSSVKAAWDLFAVVKNIANSLDLNRRRPIADSLHLEVRRRALWAIYTLDSYMCTMLGKTLTWSDSDVTDDFPSLADDGRLVVDALGRLVDSAPEGDGGPSLMEAPRAHAKLAKIVRSALRRLYGDNVGDNVGETMTELSAAVDAWENELPEFLRSRKGAPGLQMVYARQNNVIQLAHAHAQLIIFRPSLPLSHLTGGVSEASRANGAGSLSGHQSACLAAALRASHLVPRRGLTGAFWFSAYIAFCAATVCYVYVVQNPHDHRREEVLDAAARCGDLEHTLAGDGENRMARRYAGALEGLEGVVRSRLRDIEKAERERERVKIETESVPVGVGVGAGIGGGQNGAPAFVPEYSAYPPQPNPQQQYAPPPPQQQMQEYAYAATQPAPVPTPVPVPVPFPDGFDADLFSAAGGMEDAGVTFQNFQGLDATVSGGYLFGWPGGPVY